MCAGVSRVPGVQPPQGPPAHPPGHSSARQVGTQGCPKSTRAVGRGLVVNAAGRGKPRTQLEGVWTQPSLTPPALPCTTQRHLLLRPNRSVAKAATPTSDPHHTQPNRFLAHGPFQSWVIWCSWSSFPTRQQHQLQLLISSGWNPGWNQVRGSC